MNNPPVTFRQASERSIDGVFDPDDLDALDAAVADDAHYLADLVASGERSPEYLNLLCRFAAWRRSQRAAKKGAAKYARLAAMLAAMRRLVASSAHMFFPIRRAETTQRARTAASARSGEDDAAAVSLGGAA